MKAGTQSLRAVKTQVPQKYGVPRLNSLEQLFRKKRESGIVELLIAEVVDHLLVSGQPSEMELFWTMHVTRFILKHDNIS